MFSYMRIACAVPNVHLGDPAQNAAEIRKKIEEAAKLGADLVLFPELALTGYTCADLFYQKSLQKAAMEGLAEIIACTKTLSMAVAVGLPVLLDGCLYNCGALVANGKLLGLVPKQFLPNYNEFYERRWFASGAELPCRTASAARLGLPGENYDIPVGCDLVFDLGGEVRVGMEICEDLWSPLPNSTFLTLNGAEVMLNLSASNETISKSVYRKTLVQQQSARSLCAYAYVSAGELESTTDLIFSGGCMICENGAVLSEGASGIHTDQFILADIDLDKIRADRQKISTFRDAQSLYCAQHPCRVVNAPLTLCSDGTLYPVAKLPFVPSNRADRLNRCQEIFQMQVAGLARRLRLTKSKAVVGVSGGLDSTLALLVAVRAMERLNRPASDVVGVTMPCFGTTDRTYQNALELMQTLGVSTKEVNLRPAVSGHFADIDHDPTVMNATYENAQARERTQVLMDYASVVGGIVVGTGDLSELALGWCTYNGDHMSMYGVNASIPKTLVRWMIDAIAEEGLFPASKGVLSDILDTPISPELLPPDAKGQIAQVTEDLVGPYALHDFYLYHMLRFGFSPEKIFHLACRAFQREFDKKTILKWLRVFYSRFFSQQFKRSCMPDGVKVGSVCLSPRGDWRMPSDASAALWLAELDKLEEKEHV